MGLSLSALRSSSLSLALSRYGIAGRGGCRDRLHERGGVYMRRLPCDDAGVGKEADVSLGQNTAK